MIVGTPLSRQSLPARWQQDLAAAVTDPAELATLLDLPSEWIAPARRAAKHFGLKVPRSFIANMQKGDVSDPLLRQVLPLGEECDLTPGFIADPLNELAARAASGLLQKYAHRALLITTQACAVHCRYCFRREFPYQDHVSDGARWSEALAAVRADTHLRELILSGGDPLSLSTTRLRQISDALRDVSHLTMLRLHTRTPVVLPSRVDRAFTDWLTELPWRVTMVLHINHPNELAGDALDAIRALKETGITLLNQAVLLRGVNDDAAVLTELSLRLHAHGVLPYYLYLLDRVRGSAHFEVDEARGIELIDRIARELPGFLVPKLARELPGEAAKGVIAAGIKRLS
jgi:EF-P beta-lysylation protein EpmB